MCGLDFFILDRFFEKNSVSVWTSLVRLKKSQLGSDVIVLFATHVIAELMYGKYYSDSG